MNSDTVSVVLSERRDCGSTDAEKLFFHSQKYSYEFLKPKFDKMKTVHFTWCKVLFNMQKGVSFMYRCLLLNKVIATLPRQLTLAVLWTVILCQWFWVKEDNVGPQMLEKLFFLSQKTFYEFLKPNLDKMKTVHFTWCKVLFNMQKGVYFM